MKFNSCVSCFLCGSTNVVSKNYLTYNSNSVLRNIAYLIPDYVGKFMSCLIPEFRRAFRPVLANKNTLQGISSFAATALLVGRIHFCPVVIFLRITQDIIQIEISKARVAWTHS